MSTAQEPARVRGKAGVDITVRARIVDAANVALTTTSIDAVYLQVFESDGTQTHNAALVVADTFFDQIQTGAEWTADGAGYNCEFVIPGAAIASPGEYDVYLWCNPSASGASDFPVWLKASVSPVKKSAYPT